MEGKRGNQAVAGVLLVAVGFWIAGQQILHWRTLELSHLWPVIVMLVGANKIWQGIGNEDGTAGWGVGLVLMGLILLLHTEAVLPVAQSWPLFIVAHGIGLMLGGLYRRREGVRDDR